MRRVLPSLPLLGILSLSLIASAGASTEFAIGDVVPGPALWQRWPGPVAYGAGEYLALGLGEGNHAIVNTVSPVGAAPQPFATQLSDLGIPASAAFDGTNFRVLLANFSEASAPPAPWGVSLTSRRLTPSGASIGTLATLVGAIPSQIESSEIYTNLASPYASACASTGVCLVVWVDDAGNVSAARVDANDDVLDATPIAVATGAATDIYQVVRVVRVTSGFFVAWRAPSIAGNSNSADEIVGTMVSDNGVAATPSSRPSTQSTPGLGRESGAHVLSSASCVARHAPNVRGGQLHRHETGQHLAVRTEGA